MNNKGQLGVQGFILVFIGILVGLVLLSASATQVGRTTELGSINTTLADVNQDAILTPELGDQDELVGREVFNFFAWDSNGTILQSGNYTVTSNTVNSQGVSTAVVNWTTLDTAREGTNVNVSYTYEPTTYIDDAGARSIALIIIIFFALAIAVVAMVPILRSMDVFR